MIFLRLIKTGDLRINQKKYWKKNEERKLKEFGGENYGEASINMNNEKNIDDNDKETFSNSSVYSNSFSDEEENTESEKKVNIISDFYYSYNIGYQESS